MQDNTQNMLHDNQYQGHPVSRNGEFYIHRMSWKDEGWILNQSCSFWSLSDKEKWNHLKPWFDKFKNLKFCWIEEVEGHDLLRMKYQGKNPSMEFFERMNLPIVYKSNAMGGTGELNVETIQHFLGMTIVNHPLHKIPSKRKFDKKFLYLNRTKKPHRKELFWRMYDENLLGHCEWSWASHLENDPFHKTLEGKGHVVDGTDDKEWTYVPQFDTTFLSIVTESLYSNDGVSSNATFITEKTDKCLSFGHPFIMVSTPWFLKNLRILGYKTFDKWWDEGYDEVINPWERRDIIVSLIREIALEWSIEKCEKVYKEMLPTLKHNQKVSQKLVKKYKRENGVVDWLELDKDYDFVWCGQTYTPKPLF